MTELGTELICVQFMHAQLLLKCFIRSPFPMLRNIPVCYVLLPPFTHYDTQGSYTLSEAWSGVNWADLMSTQGAFGTDFYDRSILRAKHRAY